MTPKAKRPPTGRPLRFRSREAQTFLAGAFLTAGFAALAGAFLAAGFAAFLTRGLSFFSGSASARRQVRLACSKVRISSREMSFRQRWM